MNEAISAVAALVDGPLRVAVDGVSAAGKTTVADVLAALLPEARRVTIDDFHLPPPHEYYPDSFDLARFREHVLAAPRDAPLVADGVFLHHPALRDLWELTVFLRADREVALARALARDAGWMEDAEERYATRYVPGETRYLAECDPEAQADVVLDTTDLAAIRIVRSGHGPVSDAITRV